MSEDSTNVAIERTPKLSNASGFISSISLFFFVCLFVFFFSLCFLFSVFVFVFVVFVFYFIIEHIMKQPAAPSDAGQLQAALGCPLIEPPTLLFSFSQPEAFLLHIYATGFLMLPTREPSILIVLILSSLSESKEFRHV